MKQAHEVVSRPPLPESIELEKLARLPVPVDGIAPLSDALWDKALLGPARDFLARPSKGFRSQLVELAWNLAGKDCEAVPRELTASVELIHAGSLIIDDIQDDSAERRGAAALHRTYGTALAINTGNWMYYLPHELIRSLVLPLEVELQIHRAITTTMLRCHQGQALDLSIAITDIDQVEVPAVVAQSTSLKTGCLMELAATLGAVAGGADSMTCAVLARFGRDLGTGLQMLDDLGGITCAQRYEKGREDLRHARPTWPWAWLAEDTSSFRFNHFVDHARRVRGGHAPDDLLISLAKEVGAHGRNRIRHYLDTALDELEKHVGSDHTSGIRSVINRLEKSYG